MAIIRSGNPFEPFDDLERPGNHFPKNNLDLEEPAQDQQEPAQVQQEFEAYLSAGKLFLDGSRLCHSPCVCLNNNGVVVVFYRKVIGLYYQVGKYNCELNKIVWGAECSYQNGRCPQAVLSDKGVIVVVRSHVLQRRCSCRVGLVNEENLTVEWGEDREREMGHGMRPSVALVDSAVGTDSTALFFYETSGLQYRSFYSIGKVSDNGKMTFVGQPEHIALLNDCKNISVAANKQGNVLLLVQSSIGHTLSYAVGRFENGTLNNLMGTPNSFTIGYNPRVSLLNNGMAIEMHEAALGPSLVFYFGWLRNGEIEWSIGKKNENGYNPSLACNDHLKLVEFHTTSLQTVKYRTGQII